MGRENFKESRSASNSKINTKKLLPKGGSLFLYLKVLIMLRLYSYIKSL